MRGEVVRERRERSDVETTRCEKERTEERREERSYGRLRNEAKKRMRESFKRLRTRGSRCERELPALGWRVCSIGVMGQLVSYRGSSVSGRKGTPCTLLHASIEQRKRERQRERERESERPRAFCPFS